MTQEIIFDAPKGVYVGHAAQSAIDLAKEKGRAVTLLFNGVRLSVCPNSYARDIVTIYDLKMELLRLTS